MSEFKFICEDSFDKVFSKLSYRGKKQFKDTLSNLIICPERTFLELKQSSENLKLILTDVLDICFKTLYVKDISIYIFPTSNDFILKKMDGISGFTPDENTIFIFINPMAYNNEIKLSEVILHEFNHTCFFDHNYEFNLLNSFIAEGLADNYACEILKIKIPIWCEKFSLIQIKPYWNLLKNKLDNLNLHNEVFFGEKSSFPNWLGYSIGFQIIKLFRKNYPQLSWNEVIKKSPKEILELSNFNEILKELK